MTEEKNEFSSQAGIDTEAKQQKRHPYADKLNNSLKIHRRKLALLERKKALLNELYPENKILEIPEENFQEELKYVEAQLLKLATQGEIDALKKVIHEKERYFNGYMDQFEKDVADMEKHWKVTLDLAKKSVKPQIQELLSTVVMERVMEDDEKKIAFYKTLRKHV
jgi:hypothetical protein